MSLAAVAAARRHVVAAGLHYECICYAAGHVCAGKVRCAKHAFCYTGHVSRQLQLLDSKLLLWTCTMDAFRLQQGTSLQQLQLLGSKLLLRHAVVQVVMATCCCCRLALWMHLGCSRACLCSSCSRQRHAVAAGLHRRIWNSAGRSSVQHCVAASCTGRLSSKLAAPCTGRLSSMVHLRSSEWHLPCIWLSGCVCCSSLGVDRRCSGGCGCMGGQGGCDWEYFQVARLLLSKELHSDAACRTAIDTLLCSHHPAHCMHSERCQAHAGSPGALLLVVV